MKIEIDQSGKIEDTNRLTAIAFCGKKTKSLIVCGGEKRKLQKYFRKIEKPKVFVYVVFAVLICLLIKGERAIDEIVIDREYPGQEPLIKSYLLQFLRATGRNIGKGNVYFKEIGKNSKAHDTAIDAFRKKRADIKISSADVLNFLAKTKSGV